MGMTDQRQAWLKDNTAALMPLLAATAAAVKLGAMTEDEAAAEVQKVIDEQIAKAKQMKSVDFGSDEMGRELAKEEAQRPFKDAQECGRVLLTFAKLRQCYPAAPKDDILKVAGMLNAKKWEKAYPASEENRQCRCCMDCVWSERPEGLAC